MFGGGGWTRRRFYSQFTDESDSLPSSDGDGSLEDRAIGADLHDGVTARRAHNALASVLVAFVGLSLVVAFKTPVALSNDEPDHVQNIETLVAGHWYGMHLGPVKVVRIYGRTINVGKSSGTEAHQPPLYYLTLAGFQWLLRAPTQAPQQLSYLFSGPNSLLMLLRVLNIVLGALTVWFTFLAARIITTDQWTPVVAASTIGFVPRFMFLSAFVTNDNLVNLLGAILTFVALRYTVSPTRWRMAMVGSIIGLLVATKLSAVPLAVVVLVLAIRQREWFRRAESFTIGLVASVIVCGWFLVQNTIRYGSPLATRASQLYLTQIGGTGMPYGVEYRVTDPVKLILVDVPGRFLHAFFYGSAVDHAFLKSLPLPVSLAFWLILAFALASLFGRHISTWVLLVLGTLTVTALLSVWIVAFQTNTYDPRLALVGMPAIACLAALG